MINKSEHCLWVRSIIHSPVNSCAHFLSLKSADDWALWVIIVPNLFRGWTAGTSLINFVQNLLGFKCFCDHPFCIFGSFVQMILRIKECLLPQEMPPVDSLGPLQISVLREMMVNIFVGMRQNQPVLSSNPLLNFRTTHGNSWRYWFVWINLILFYTCSMSPQLQENLNKNPLFCYICIFLRFTLIFLWWDSLISAPSGVHLHFQQIQCQTR